MVPCNHMKKHTFYLRIVQNTSFLDGFCSSDHYKLFKGNISITYKNQSIHYTGEQIHVQHVFQVYKKDTRTRSVDVVLVSLLLTRNMFSILTVFYFEPCSSSNDFIFSIEHSLTFKTFVKSFKGL